MIDVPDYDLKDFVYKPDTFGTIRAIGIDEYPGEMPIIRELIQNADDSNATTVTFRIDDEKIIVENDGDPFSKPSEVNQIEDSDFYRISKIGIGKTEEELTGTFGVGFTSVFHITDKPRIISNGWDFEIHINEVPSISLVPFNRITRFYLPLRLAETEISKKINAELFDLKKLKKFEEQLLSEVYQDIFFLKTVRKIEAYKKGEKFFSVSKKISHTEDTNKNLKRHLVSIRIISQTNERKKRSMENWSFYSLQGLAVPPNFNALEQKLEQKVELAIPINLTGGRIRKQLITKNYAYCTLPVIPTDLNFKYNTSKFYTTSGRSEFVTKEGLKRDWNLWQMDNIATLLSLVFEDLISRKVNPRTVCELIPSYSQFQPLFDEYLCNSFKKKVEAGEIRLFYTAQNVWRNNDQLYMNWNGLHKVLQDDSGIYLIHPSLKNYSSVFLSYDINDYGLENFVNYLESKYGTSTYNSNKSEKSNQIKKIFEYLGNNSIPSILIEKLRKICILLTEEGILRSFQYKVFFPTDEKMPLINKDDILHHLTYNTIAARRFLQKKLKVKKIDLNHLILDSFLPRVNSYNNEQKFEFVWYLVKRQRDVIRKPAIIKDLKEKIQDIIITEHTDKTEYPIFFSDIKLKTIFQEKLNYLSPRYEEQGKKDKIKWKSFFRKLGVEDLPNVNVIITIAQEMESVEFSSKNAIRVERVLTFLDSHWKKYYSKHTEELQKSRNYRWMPSNKMKFEYPTDVYVKKRTQELVGRSKQFLAIRSPKNKNLVKVLGLLTEARLDDVIEFILNQRGEEKGESDKRINFKVYSFLNRRVNLLTNDHLQKLRDNRTIWFKGRLWNPKKLYLHDYSNCFGPNGWLRGYLKNNKLSKINRLCLALDIKSTIQNPYDYLEWLADAADNIKDEVPESWQINLFRYSYSKVIQFVNTIPEKYIEKLSNKKVIVTSEPRLRLPSECFLLRKSEQIIYERIIRTGISVPLIEAECAEHEKLYLRLGMNEIATSLSVRRTDESKVFFNEALTEKFQSILPWLDGLEFSLTGELSDYNLEFQQMKVYGVNNLEVLYLLEGRDGKHNGQQIHDVCCYEKNISALYLDRTFQLHKPEHLRLLTLNLLNSLNPAVNKIGWNLAIPMLLTHGQIMGVSPYNRETHMHEHVPEFLPPKVEIHKESFEIKKPKEILKTKQKTIDLENLTSEDLLVNLARARSEATKVVARNTFGRRVLPKQEL